MLMKVKFAAVVLAVGMQAAQAAPDYFLAAGESDTITTNVTYQTMTVNGDLTVTSTLTFGDMHIADGVGTTGSVTIQGDGSFTSTTGTVYVGYNGGVGKFVDKANGSSRYFEIGHGNGDGCEIEVHGYLNSRQIIKPGTGRATVSFHGGELALGAAPPFVPTAGELTLKSVNGAPIAYRTTAANDTRTFPFDGTDGTGTLRTEGTGAVVLTRSSAAPSTVRLASCGNRIIYGHTGGVKIQSSGSGSNRSMFVRALAADCLAAADGSYQKLILDDDAQFDLNGFSVPVGALSGYGMITNRSVEGCLVLGADNASCTNDFLGTIAQGVRIRKSGTGETSIPVVAFDGVGTLAVEEGTLTLAKRGGVGYRHYMFRIDDAMGTGRNSIQLSEFRLLDGETDVTAGYSSWDGGAEDRAGSNQSGSKILDGDMGTKWLSMAAGAGTATAEARSNMYMRVTYSVPRWITGYDWATANDSGYGATATDCRDPMKWHLLGSDDGEHWDILDERDIGKTNLVRTAWTGPYTVTERENVSRLANDVTITGGKLAVGGPFACRNVEQKDGLVEISAGAYFGFTGGWYGAVFSSDSVGEVRKVGTGTSGFYGPSVTFRGDVVAAEGTLGFKYVNFTYDRLFRFTVTRNYGDACIQLSRFRLYDAAGNVLSDGLTAAAAGTAPSSLAAGQCCYAATYTEGGSSNVKNLFDGATGTKMCLTQLHSPIMTAEDARTVYFRLPDSVTAVVAGYSMTTANDSTPGRNPVDWTLSSSADGVNWTVLDEKTGAPGPTSTYTDFNNGMLYPVAQQPSGETLIAPAVVTFDNGVSVSVADGATIDFRNATAPVKALKVDCAAGAGTIEGFVAAEEGAFHLTGVSGPLAAGYTLPLTIGSFGTPKSVNKWTIDCDGTVQSGYFMPTANGFVYGKTGTVIIVR